SVTSASLLMLPSGCRSNPCGYGGTCLENILRSIDSGYKCQCIPGRIGNHCEYRKYECTEDNQ
ncbi:unnamed protein product, partial [Rotaria magnacalcarata]